MKGSVGRGVAIAVFLILGSTLWAQTGNTAGPIHDNPAHKTAGSRPAGDRTASDLKLTVLIYNLAEVPRLMLSGATEVAARVFRRVGVETVWMDCTATAAEAPKNPACPQRRKPTHLVLRILPREMAERFGLHRSVFGFALPASREGFGLIANVFFHRVRELARSRGEEERPIILGHMLAHEMGHLLLGRNSHSKTGIMHVPWNRDQLDRARFYSLPFTLEEAEQIRQQVLERSAVESDPELL